MCSTSGSLTVMWCKGLGLAIRETIAGMVSTYRFKKNYFVLRN